MALALKISFDGATAESVHHFARPSSGSAVKRYTVTTTKPLRERAQLQFTDSGTDDYGLRGAILAGEYTEPRTDMR